MNLLWVRWFPRDYQSDTKHLTWLEDCAYRRLLDEIYIQGHGLPADREELYRLIGATKKDQKQAVENVLKRFFFERHQKLFNSRASSELQRARDIRLTKVKAGRQRAKLAASAEHPLSIRSAIQSRADTDIRKPPLPPVNGGPDGLHYIERHGQTIAIAMHRRRRLPNGETAGMSNEDFVAYLTRKGFPAHIQEGEKHDV